MCICPMRQSETRTRVYRRRQITTIITTAATAAVNNYEHQHYRYHRLSTGCGLQPISLEKRNNYSQTLVTINEYSAADAQQHLLFCVYACTEVNRYI